jgi:hypothetical protein
VSPADGANVLDDFIEMLIVDAIIRLDHGQSSNSSSDVQRNLRDFQSVRPLRRERDRLSPRSSLSTSQEIE